MTINSSSLQMLDKCIAIPKKKGTALSSLPIYTPTLGMYLNSEIYKP